MEENNKFTRKALLFHSGNDFSDVFQSELDFGLVKCFLQSASGGSFRDDEILQSSLNEFSRKDLFELIDSFDYTFIYFSGHSHYENRKIKMSLKNDEFINEAEFIRPGKKQWIFMDCCRSGRTAPFSKGFEIPRKECAFPAASQQNRDNWEASVKKMDSFYLLYYVTELDDFAHTNRHGGYGTQIFFMSLMDKLTENSSFHFQNFIEEINTNESAVQKGNYILGNLDLEDFSNLFVL